MLGQLSRGAVPRNNIYLLKTNASEYFGATGKKGEQLHSISVVKWIILLGKKYWTDDYCYSMEKVEDIEEE